MKKKGFTLAELLGVIVIISLLLILIIPSIINSIAAKKDSSESVSNGVINTAVQQYIDENSDIFPQGKSGKYCVPIKDLIDKGYLTSPVKDVNTNKDISDKTVLVTIYSQGTSDFEITESKECSAQSSAPYINFLVSPSGSSWVKQRTVTIVYPKVDGNYESKYKIDEGNWISDGAGSGGQTKLTFDKISTLTAQLSGSDTISNKYKITNVDSVNPLITNIKLDSWSNEKQKVEITVKDTISGIDGIYISTSDTKPSESSNWTSLSSDANEEKVYTNNYSSGVYYVWTKDKAGNISDSKSFTVSDIIKPTCKITASGTLGNNNWYTSDVKLSLTASDNESGVASKGLNETNNEEYSVIDKTLNYDSSSKTYYGFVKDKAGNVGTCTLTVKRDATDPILSVSTTSTTNSITVVANASALSGISKYEYSKDGGSTWVTGNNVYTFNNLSSGVGGVSPSSLKSKVVTSGDGLYSDSTESGRYIYRGANPNNYITLGSDMYRIISVEKDGTLKVIKNGSIGSKSFDAENARYSAISTDYCNSSYGCNVWGSRTTMLDSNGNNVTTMPREVGGTEYNLPFTEAYLNTYLNNAWYNSLSSTVQSKIVTHLFNVGVIKYDETNLSNTITQEKTYKWKGKVGLMTASDYVKASTNSTCTSVRTYVSTSSCYNNSTTHNWIFAGPVAKSWSWTISPYSLSFAENEFYVHGGGSLSGLIANHSFGVAPAFYLSSDISLTGEGTEGSPYTLDAEVTYPIKVRVTSGVERQTTSSEINTNLKSIPEPTFTESGTTTKTVKITYPSGCGSTYTCTYQKDDETEVTVTSTTASVSFTEDGSVVAKVSDGTNTASSSYTVKVEDPEPIMMARNTSKAFWQSDYNSKISTVDILTNKDVPSDAVASWDVSEKQNGTVMAWIINDTENSGMYKLYIGGDGKVIAPSNSSHLFSGFYSSFSKTISMNLANFDTSKVTDMYSMFDCCSSLTSLNVSNFNTSNVKYMNYMFSGCSSLTSLDVSNFDTSKVTDMEYMFSGCSSLTSLDVSNFDTSNVTDMWGMFYDCSSLTKLNLCSFDTSKVTIMWYMFCNTSKLTAIYTGSNWTTTASATTTYMFTGSGVSAVTVLDNCAYDTEEINVSLAHTSTTNSITIVAKASATSGISKYEFSKDDGSTWIESNSNTYTFTDLTQETSYNIKVRVTSNLKKQATSDSTTVSTDSIIKPTFIESGTTTKTVKITYPSGCGSTYTCTYQKDDETEVTVTSTTASVSFTEDGTVVAKVSDNANTASSSYTVKVEDPEPIMMARDTSKAFWQSDYNSKISTVDILTNKDVPSDAVASWDVSEKQNGTVMAWIINDTENSGMYKLYIGGDGKVIAPSNSSYMFYVDSTNFGTFYKTTSMNLENLDTSNVTNMSSMFDGCISLTSLDVSNFDTSNVTNMSGMFSYCISLTSLDVSNLNTSKVTDMSGMFFECSSLTSLNVSNFDTSKVIAMRSMFSDCKSLTSLNVSNFNTSKVTDMSDMFGSCKSLTSLDVSNFDTSKVTDMGYMFYYCSSFTSLNVSNFDTSNVTAMSGMFSACRSLTSLNVSNFDTSNVISMDHMFSGCSSLTSLNVSNFDTSKVTDMSWMFHDCSKLTSLNVSNFDTSNITAMNFMFGDCSSLTKLNLCSFDTSKVTNMNRMFDATSKLKQVNVGSKWNTSSATTASMFAGSGVSAVTKGQC